MKPQALIKDDFKNLLEYQQWVKTAFSNLSDLNNNQHQRFESNQTERIIKAGWYGENVTYEELSKGVKEYKRPELLEELYRKVSHEIPPVLTQKLKARKMKFNSLGFGMFCFDRAAMTMYRNEEFYCPSLKIKLHKSEIKQIGNTYNSLIDGSKVIKRWEQKPDGSPKIRTHTKDLFAYFPEVSRDKHSVEIFLYAGGASEVKADAMLYAGVSAIIMSELLMKAGIKVKINVVIGSCPESNRKKFFGCVIPVKQYDETLDRNVIALLSSDPRFFRYDGLKGVVSAYDHFKTEMPQGFGYPMSSEQLRTLFEESGYTANSQAMHRYYFGGNFSEAAALNDISNTIKDIAKFLK